MMFTRILAVTAMALVSLQASALDLNKGALCDVTQKVGNETQKVDTLFVVASTFEVSLNTVKFPGSLSFAFGDRVISANPLQDLKKTPSLDDGKESAIGVHPQAEGLGAYVHTRHLNLDLTTGVGTLRYVRDQLGITSINAPMGDVDVSYDLECKNASAEN